jgi:hypothetical protein
LEPGLEPQAHVRVRMYRYSGATPLPSYYLPLPSYDGAQLVATFSAGLYSVPHLRVPLRVISKHHIDQALSQDEVISANTAVGASWPPSVQLSRKWSSAHHGPNPRWYYSQWRHLTRDITLRPTLRARPPLDHIRPLNPEATRARIDALFLIGRLSSATRVCKNLDNHLKGHSPTFQPPAAVLTHIIEQLHPANDDRDILPDQSLDPPIETSIQVPS